MLKVNGYLFALYLLVGLVGCASLGLQSPENLTQRIDSLN